MEKELYFIVKWVYTKLLQQQPNCYNSYLHIKIISNKHDNNTVWYNRLQLNTGK